MFLINVMFFLIIYRYISEILYIFYYQRLNTSKRPLGYFEAAL